MSIRQRLLTGLLAGLIASAGVTQSPVPASAQSSCGAHVVVDFGDTLTQIARRCGVSLDALMAANPLLPNAYFIFPGMRINVPRAVAAPAPQASQRYTVRPGDTIASIARVHGVTMAEVFALNPDLDARTLRAGAVIRLPARAAPTPPPPSQTNVVRYTVRPGDTIASIARAHGVTSSQILALNPSVDPRYLRVGEVLRIQGGVVPPTPVGTVGRYTVRAGDTLSSIARANNGTTSEILALNPGLDGSYLRVGQVISVPVRGGQPAPTPPSETNIIRYTVRPGDTVSSIARAHGVTTSQIQALNPGLDPRYLRVGDVVRIQGGIVPPPASNGADIRLSPQSGPPGTVVAVAASGFPAAARLRLSAGRSASTLRQLQELSTDAAGRASVNVRIPDWAADAGSMVFAFEPTDGRLRILSDPFRVTAASTPDRISVTGTLTREGAECQALRGDDGRLYTIARGTIGGFAPGDRVRVEGRVAEVSTCMQGTTIDVRRIEAIR